MKKLFFLFILTFTLFSCNDKEEISHSEVITWVEVNRQEIQDYSRKQILDKDQELREHILGALNPKSKKRIWLNKMEHVLELDLTIQEKEYLKSFKTDLLSIDYSKPNKDNLDQKLYEKVIIGMREFNWSKEFVYNVFFVIDDVNFRNGKQHFTHVDNEGGGIGGDLSKCNCRYHIGCPWFQETCRKGGDYKCEPRYNCGVFGTSECTGICN